MSILHGTGSLQGLTQGSRSGKQSLCSDGALVLPHTNTYVTQLCCISVTPVLYLQPRNCSQSSIYKSHLQRCQKGNYLFSPTTVSMVINAGKPWLIRNKDKEFSHIHAGNPVLATLL